MTHHIFLIHGMGDFKDGWSKAGDPGVKKQLENLFATYADTKDLASNYEIHEINYNKVFEAWRDKWQELSKNASTAATALKITSGLASDLIKLGGAFSGDGFVKTHILDVFLYRFAKIITQEVMAEVQTQLGTLLEKLAKTAVPLEYSVIAHSLGTVVAYETFHAMMTDKKPLPPSARPNNVFMVANVTAALWQRGPQIYLPAMAPNLRFESGWCYRLANFGHRLDPVARLRPFDPPDAWFQPGKKDSTYTDVWLKEEDVKSINVHALTHYLGHPSVHIPILRQLTNPAFISKEVEEAAIETWRKERDDILSQKVEDALTPLLLKLSPDLLHQLALIASFRDLVLKSDDANPDGDKI